MESDRWRLCLGARGRPFPTGMRWLTVAIAAVILSQGMTPSASAQNGKNSAQPNPSRWQGALLAYRERPVEFRDVASQLAADQANGPTALDAMEQPTPAHAAENQQTHRSRATDEAGHAHSELEPEGHEHEEGQEEGHGAGVRLVAISLDGLFAAGTSTVRDPALQELEGGCHDPRKRGFTLRGAEFSMQGAVDPYVDGVMHLVTVVDPIVGETVVELEEAYMTTKSLPGGLQLKAGQFLTEFGQINPTHPHAWAWLDQPIINTRIFGPDGLGAPGVRLSWQAPTEHYSQVYMTVQNAHGEMMASFLANAEYFEERPIGGRPFTYRDVRSLEDLIYTLRWENSWTSCDGQVTWLLGQSAAFGPNCTGPSGNTQVYGLDLSRKWYPSRDPHGWPFTIWMSEVMVRRYRADAYVGPDPADPETDLDLSAETLTDWGFYTQYLYGFRPKWAVGLRYEYASGSGYSLNDNYIPISHNEDPFRDYRHRLSPLLAWYPSESCRFNFQYNFDYAEHLPSRDAHSFWIGAEFMLGNHPTHKH